MKKKMITLLLAGATVAAVFAGCGNKTEDASATPVPTGVVEATETPAPTESTPAGETTVAPTEEAVPTEVPTATETPEAPSAADAIVHLGQYKGLKLYEVDSKVVAEEMHQTMEAFAELTVVNRAAAEGDTVNINYVGKKDGVAFAGGTDDSETGSDLTLGSGMFIPGFEEGLIGATAGEVRDLNLTFPEDYHSAELAGQEVVFTVTVNAVKESVVPELTDAFVAENLGFDTVAEYTMALYQKKNEESFIAQIWDALLTTSTIENYPESLHEYEKKQLVDYYMGMAEYYAPWYGMDTETFLINSFGSMEVFYEMCDAYAKDTVTQNLILTEIATQENLTITEEQYRQSALNLAIQSGYEDVETFEADYGKDELFRDITEVYIIAHVISLSEVVKAESDGNIQQVE